MTPGNPAYNLPVAALELFLTFEHDIPCLAKTAAAVKDNSRY
jgi:hypothetical protein